MKKRILLFVAIMAMLMCVLAISVSATEPDTTKEAVTLDDGTVCPIWDTDGNPLIWYVTGTNDGVKSYDYVVATDEAVDYYVSFNYKLHNETFYTVSSIKITANGTTYNQSKIAVLNMRADNILSTSANGSGNVGKPVNSMSKLFKDSSNLEYAYLPVSIGDLNGENFSGCTALKYVNIAELTELKRISGTEFYRCSKLFANQVLDLRSTKLNELGAGAFAEISATEIILPTTLTKINSWVFQKCKSLTKVTFNSQITSMNSEALFNGCSALEEVEGFAFPENYTTIGKNAFNGCSSLKNIGGFIVDYEFTSPDGITTIGWAAFENSSLTRVVLSEGVTTLENCAFKGSKGLTSVTLPTTLTTLSGSEHFYNTGVVEIIGLESTQITEIPYAIFRGLKNWTPDVVKLPNTVTKINKYSFADAGIKSIILGSGFTTFGGDEAFVNCPNLEVVYLPGTITTFASSTFANKLRGDILFIVTSNDATYLESVKSNFGCADIVSYDTYASDSTAYSKGKHVISGYDICEAFYEGIHQLIPEKSNACAGECANCHNNVLANEPKHDYIVAISYTNYLASGVKTQTCQNEGCVHNITPNEVAVNAIIKEFKGISTKENGDGLTFGYIIDYDALDEYMEISGNKVELGFVVAVKAFLGENQPLKENGEKAGDKVIKVEIYSSSASDEQIRYTGADFKLTGSWDKTVEINGEKTDIKNVVFYMAGYIMDGNELSYINSDASGKEAGTAYYNQFQ